MLRLISSNFKKCFTDITFYMCIVLVFGLCFTATVISDPVTEDPLTVLDLIIRNDSQLVLDNVQLNAFEIFRAGGTGNWLVMFLPIIVSFSFAKRFCDSRESRFIRLETIRLSRLSYNLGTVISAVLLSGLAVVIGYLLYGIYTAAVFPDLSYYPSEADYYLHAFDQLLPPFDMLYDIIGMSAGYIALLLGMFLYASLSVLPAVLAASVMRNQYLIICLPFFASYIMTIICQRLWGVVFTDVDATMPYLSTIATAIHPAAIENIFLYGNTALPTVIYNAVLAAGAVTLFIIAMNRRLDKGE